MSLKITRLALRDFRNYSAFVVEPDPGLTVVVGPNAAGKTNLIEALQLTCATKSFRRPAWSDLVRQGCGEALIEVTAQGEVRHLELELRLGAHGGREYRINGKRRRKLQEVAEIMPCVVFTPDDLRLVKDSAQRRRDALDDVAWQIAPAYSALKLEYERALRQRNRLLKEERRSASEMVAWTESLISTGVRFGEARARLFAKLRSRIERAYEAMAGEDRLLVEYVSSWTRDGHRGGQDIEEALREHLKRTAEKERARGMTLAGPHRDDIVFLIGGADARTMGSQGQQRSIALSWKLAEVGLVEETAGRPPLLLLDDVMSELDEDRRTALTRLVSEAAQTMITTTNLGYFDPAFIGAAKVVELSR